VRAVPEEGTIGLCRRTVALGRVCRVAHVYLISSNVANLLPFDTAERVAGIVAKAVAGPARQCGPRHEALRL
jgi:hypothetical protein